MAKTQKPQEGRMFTVRGFVSRLRDFPVKDEDGNEVDYAYGFGISHPLHYFEVALFDDAKGHVEGEVFEAATGRFSKVDPLRNGAYVEVKGVYSQSDWKNEDGSGTNHRLKVTVARNLKRLAAPQKRTKRVRFCDDGQARQEKPDAPKGEALRVI